MDVGTDIGLQEELHEGIALDVELDVKIVSDILRFSGRYWYRLSTDAIVGIPDNFTEI